MVSRYDTIESQTLNFPIYNAREISLLHNSKNLHPAMKILVLKNKSLCVWGDAITAVIMSQT